MVIERLRSNLSWGRSATRAGGCLSMAHTSMPAQHFVLFETRRLPKRRLNWTWSLRFSVPLCDSVAPVSSVASSVGVDEAFHAVHQPRHVEVDEQAHRTASQTQIGQDLCLMDVCQCSNRLDVDHHKVFDDQVDSIGRVEHRPFVDDWNGLLYNEPQVSRRQLELDAIHVDRFQQPGTERSMHLDRGSQYHSRDIVKGRWLDEHLQR